MANWYKQNQTAGNVRYRAVIVGDVFVPPNPMKGAERDTAYNILHSSLSKIEGDASAMGIDSNLSFSIDSVKSYDELV